MRVINIQLQDCARGNGELPHRRPLQIGEGVHPLCASRDPARLAQVRGAEYDRSISKIQYICALCRKHRPPPPPHITPTRLLITSACPHITPASLLITPARLPITSARPHITPARLLLVIGTGLVELSRSCWRWAGSITSSRLKKCRKLRNNPVLLGYGRIPMLSRHRLPIIDNLQSGQKPFLAGET